MSILKRMFGKKEDEVDSSKVKGIYLMTCSLGSVDKNLHSRLAAQALQDLRARNSRFQKVNAQAIKDKPGFHEGFQQIGYIGQPLDVMIANFKVWLQQQGVVINESRWDKYFFCKDSIETTLGVQKNYVLIYFHT